MAIERQPIERYKQDGMRVLENLQQQGMDDLTMAQMLQIVPPEEYIRQQYLMHLQMQIQHQQIEAGQTWSEVRTSVERASRAYRNSIAHLTDQLRTRRRRLDPHECLWRLTISAIARLEYRVLEGRLTSAAYMKFLVAESHYRKTLVTLPVDEPALMDELIDKYYRALKDILQRISLEA
jgi:hypothetical protein